MELKALIVVEFMGEPHGLSSRMCVVDDMKLIEGKRCLLSR